MKVLLIVSCLIGVLGLVPGCGDDIEIAPNGPDCPLAPAISQAACDAVLDKKVCHWEDEQAGLRVWCKCNLPVWDCWQDPL